MARTEAEKAERLSRLRAGSAIGLGLAFPVAQTLSLGDPVWGSSNVIHLLAWFVWAAAFAVFLVWGAGLFRGRIARLANDETTVENRNRALGMGFWGAVIAAFLAYWASFYEPITARDACRFIITFAATPALIRFGLLELRAIRDG